MLKLSVGFLALGVAGMLGAGQPSLAAVRSSLPVSVKVPGLRAIEPSRTIDAQVLPATPASAEVPQAVDALSKNRVYALVQIGAGVRLAATRDGGRIWTLRGAIPADGAAPPQMQFVNRRVGYALVGGTIWSSDNGGRSWKRLPESRLQDLTFATPTTGMAIRGGAVIGTHDGGLAWTTVLEVRGETFQGVSLVSPRCAYASAVSSRAPTLYRTTDGGRRWIRIAAGVHTGPWAAAFRQYVHTQGLARIMRPSGLQFNQGARVTFTTANDGWVDLFDGGLIATAVFHTLNGGRSWSYAWGNSGCAMLCNAHDQGLYPAGYQGGNTVWRYDGRRLDRSTDGGRTWTVGGALPVSASALGDGLDPGMTTFITPKIGWMATQAAIFATTNGGNTWQQQWPVGPQQVSQAVFAAHGEGWLVTVDAPGRIWGTTNGGRSWTEEARTFTDIAGMDRWGSGGGMVVVSDGADWITHDNGQTWTPDRLPARFRGTANPAVWVQFVNRQAGFLATLTGLWRTTDGGTQWTQVHVLPQGLFAASFPTATDGWQLTENSANPYQKVALAITHTGGRTWHTVGTLPNNAPHLYFETARNGWIVDGNYGHLVLHTQNGGQSWVRVKIPHVSTRSITAHGQSVYLVSQSGRLFESRDDGRIWQQMVP